MVVVVRAVRRLVAADLATRARRSILRVFLGRLVTVVMMTVVVTMGSVLFIGVAVLPASVAVTMGSVLFIRVAVLSVVATMAMVRRSRRDRDDG